MVPEAHAAAPNGPARVRIGMTSVDEELSPAGWSGVPYGLARGLRSYGAEPVPASSQLPGALSRAVLLPSAIARRSRLDAYYTAEQHGLRSLVAARRLRRRDALDDVVLMGAELDLPATTRYVTLLDLTLAQAKATHPVFSRLQPSTVRGWHQRQRRVYAAARACCPASHATAESLVRDYGVDPSRIHVVGFGRNHDPQPRTGAWDQPRFLFIGREWERKNGPAVLRAFAQVRERHPDAVLDLVGGHPRVDAPGVVGHGELRLDVPAERGRVEELLSRATCFVMPSEAEPFGIVYAEAAAAGVPSIATSVGGARTIVGDDAGILVDPGDAAQLVDAMERLADPATARAMGAAALRRAPLFTWEVVAGRILRALAPAGLDVSDLPQPL